MCRHIRIAATAAIALSLLLAPQSALAQDKPEKPKTTAEILAIISADPLEGPAHDAYFFMRQAKERCDPGAYAAHRTRLLGAIAAMRYHAKKAKKLKGFANQDPEDLKTRAEDYEALMKMVDEQPWPCPSTSGFGNGYVPEPASNKSHSPDWAIALASQHSATIHDGFDSPGTGSSDGLAMVDRALRAARPNMSDAAHPCGGGKHSASHQADPRYPAGFAPMVNSVGQMTGFGWGPGF